MEVFHMTIFVQSTPEDGTQRVSVMFVASCSREDLAKGRAQASASLEDEPDHVTGAPSGMQRPQQMQAFGPVTGQCQNLEIAVSGFAARKFRAVELVTAHQKPLQVCHVFLDLT
jgi:hypothetical protein